MLILQLLRAEIAQRGMEPALVVDLLDVVGKVFGDVLECFERDGAISTPRPHSSLSYRIPAAYAKMLTATGSGGAQAEGSAPPPVAPPSAHGVTETRRHIGRIQAAVAISELRRLRWRLESEDRSLWTGAVAVTGTSASGGRPELQRFWLGIAQGLTSEDAALAAGMSQRVQIVPTGGRHGTSDVQIFRQSDTLRLRNVRRSHFFAFGPFETRDRTPTRPIRADHLPGATTQCRTRSWRAIGPSP